MTFILLTFRDGTPVYINKENVVLFSKDILSLFPKISTHIRTSDGRDLFVKETVEEVKKLLDEN